MFKKIALCLLSLSTPLFAFEFESPKKTQFVELYSSQGCSSCPPAEKWLSKLAQSPKLWQETIPIVFHVDYWDYLGWDDPFASYQNTQRQINYKEKSAIKSVYTPGFLVNGQEWKGYFKGQDLPEAKALAGKIKVLIKDKKIQVTYDQDMTGKRFQARLVAHKITTKILRGENTGRRLKDGFIAFQSAKSKVNQKDWELSFPKTALPVAERFALIVWVEDTNTQAPIQAAGSWVDPKELF